MIKMLHLAACDWRRGAVGSTEAEGRDVLWALEEMPAFKSADDQIALEKASKDDINKVKKDGKTRLLSKKLPAMLKYILAPQRL
jgi:hypothetical protein